MKKAFASIIALFSIIALTACSVTPPSSEEIRKEFVTIAKNSQNRMWDNGLVEEVKSKDNEALNGNKIIYNADNPYYPVVYYSSFKKSGLLHNLEVFAPNMFVQMSEFQADDIIFSKSNDQYIISIEQVNENGNKVVIKEYTITVKDKLITEFTLRVLSDFNSTKSDTYSETLTYSLDSNDLALFKDGQKELSLEQ